MLISNGLLHVLYAIAANLVAALGPNSKVFSDSDTRLTFSCFQGKVVDDGVKGVKRRRRVLWDGEIASVMLSQPPSHHGGGGLPKPNNPLRPRRRDVCFECPC